MVGVQNFEIPKTCRDCKCYIEFGPVYDDIVGCVFTRNTYNHGLTHRPSDCPLMDLPDGDLMERMGDDGK